MHLYYKLDMSDEENTYTIALNEKCTSFRRYLHTISNEFYSGECM